MKRSEMVDKVHSMLDSEGAFSDKKDASIFLYILEELGMSPPKKYGTMGQVISQGWDNEERS